MNRRTILITIIVIIAGVVIYERFMPQPLVRDFNKNSFKILKLSDMNQMLIIEFPSNHTYRSADPQQFVEVQKHLMNMKVTRKKDIESIGSSIYRDDEVLKIRFFNDDTTFAISYTFYENGDLLYAEHAMVNKIEMLRHVSKGELERVKALVLEGMTME